MIDNELQREVATALVGVEPMLDIKFPGPHRLREPRNPAELAAFKRVIGAIDALQKAIEAYEISRGVWHGKPKVAIGWTTPAASGAEPQQDAAP